MHRPLLSTTLLLLTLGCSNSDTPPTTDPQDLPGGLTRAEDPVVLTGAQVSSLGGTDATDIVAFARQNDAWTQRRWTSASYRTPARSTAKALPMGASPPARPIINAIFTFTGAVRISLISMTKWSMARRWGSGGQ